MGRPGLTRVMLGELHGAYLMYRIGIYTLRPPSSPPLFRTCFRFRDQHLISETQHDNMWFYGVQCFVPIGDQEHCQSSASASADLTWGTVRAKPRLLSIHKLDPRSASARYPILSVSFVRVTSAISSPR